MNINYEDIIEKAQQRAEKLKEFQEYVAGADNKAHELLNLLLYFANLGNRANALDAEGRAMLGETANRARRIGDYTSGAYRTLTEGDLATVSGSILKLVEALK